MKHKLQFFHSTLYFGIFWYLVFPRADKEANHEQRAQIIDVLGEMLLSY